MMLAGGVVITRFCQTPSGRGNTLVYLDDPRFPILADASLTHVPSPFDVYSGLVVTCAWQGPTRNPSTTPSGGPTQGPTSLPSTRPSTTPSLMPSLYPTLTPSLVRRALLPDARDSCGSGVAVPKKGPWERVRVTCLFRREVADACLVVVDQWFSFLPLLRHGSHLLSQPSAQLYFPHGSRPCPLPPSQASSLRGALRRTQAR